MRDRSDGRKLRESFYDCSDRLSWRCQTMLLWSRRATDFKLKLWTIYMFQSQFEFSEVWQDRPYPITQDTRAGVDKQCR